MKKKIHKAKRQFIEQIEELINDCLNEIQENQGTLEELTKELENYQRTGKMSEMLKGYLGIGD